MLNSLLLLPQPQQLISQDGVYVLPDQALILLDGPDLHALRTAAHRVQQALREHSGLCWETVASPAVPPDLISLALRIRPGASARPQGYSLTITPGRIELTASDAAGLFYGACTLAQIIPQAGKSLPCLAIDDWPDFPARGVLLDISRDKVPTMDTLRELVDMLAGWKINQLQLYTEHTFAYRRHPQVWASASPLTGEEILELDAFCRERFIELVPNQNSFGHMNRWLKLPAYQPLAEVTGGFEMPWGHEEGSNSLCPGDPGSLELVLGLYDELLPHFASRMINIGCDETYDVGQGRSRAEVAQRGAGRVYLDFLLKLAGDLRQRGLTVQFWADILQHHPEFISELPDGMVALEWGYEAGHPFEKRCARLAEAGIPFYVCPGTSAWSSLFGRTGNALGNLKRAAESGLGYGAIGYLNTDWGDNGHWQTLPASYLGFAAGAAFSWAYQANCDLDAPRALSLYAFRDPTGVTGRVAYDLGDVYKIYGSDWENSSVLSNILQRPLRKVEGFKGMSRTVMETLLAAINQAVAPLAESRMEGPDEALVRRELELAAWMMRHACKRGMLAVERDPRAAAALARSLDADMQAIVAEYQAVWLGRNRPGGLADSVARLEKARQDYVAVAVAPPPGAMA